MVHRTMSDSIELPEKKLKGKKKKTLDNMCDMFLDPLVPPSKRKVSDHVLSIY